MGVNFIKKHSNLIISKKFKKFSFIEFGVENSKKLRSKFRVENVKL